MLQDDAYDDAVNLQIALSIKSLVSIQILVQSPTNSMDSLGFRIFSNAKRNC